MYLSANINLVYSTSRSRSKQTFKAYIRPKEISYKSYHGSDPVPVPNDISWFWSRAHSKYAWKSRSWTRPKIASKSKSKSWSWSVSWSRTIQKNYEYFYSTQTTRKQALENIKNKLLEE